MITKEKLKESVEQTKCETRIALQTLYDNLNRGQQKRVIKAPEVKALFDRYSVEYEE